MVIATPLLFMLSPLLIVLVGLLSDQLNIPRIRDILAIIISASGIGAISMIYTMVQNAENNILVVYLGNPPPLGASFEIDLISVFIAFSVTFLGFFATVYSYNYMEHDSRLTEYYTLLSALIVGMIGVAFAGDFFTLFIFWELMSLASYTLVSFRKESWGPIEAGFKYMVMGAIGSTILFFGMALLYGMAGTVNFAQISSVIHGQPFNLWLFLVFAFILIGFGVKAAIFPLHTWLPDAHPEAPSPISAMLSGMLIETGLYAMLRILFLIFEPSFFKIPIAVLAVLTMTVANITALLQSDIKRMLAYSSIAQIGYMLIGLAVGTSYGAMGLLLHIFNHSLMKGMAFLAAGSLIHEADTREISDLQGIGRKMPLTTFSLFTALLGLGGVPGTNGFISKFVLFNSAIGSGLSWLAIAGILNSVLSMAYYLRTMRFLVSEPLERIMNLKEVPVLMVSVTLSMVVLVILTGLFPAPVINIANLAADSFVDGLNKYLEVIL
jgi:proton-translocating NADH-quinone oxidoreductase chain N